MFKYQAQIAELLNQYIGKEHQFGINDCNILVADYLDKFKGTDYVSKLKGQYSSIQDGLKVAKQVSGFSTALEAVEKHLELQSSVTDGSIVLSKKIFKRKPYYIASVVFKNKVLIEQDGQYKMSDIKYFDYEFIYK